MLKIKYTLIVYEIRENIILPSISYSISAKYKVYNSLKLISFELNTHTRARARAHTQNLQLCLSRLAGRRIF